MKNDTKYKIKSISDYKNWMGKGKSKDAIVTDILLTHSHT